MDRPDASNSILALRRAATDVIGFSDLGREMVLQRAYGKAIEYQALAAAGCLRLGTVAETLLPLMEETAPRQAKTIEQMRARIVMLALGESCLSFDESADDSDDLMSETARAFHSDAVLVHGTKLALLILNFTKAMEKDDE